MKPSKKRIEEVAKKIRDVFLGDKALYSWRDANWKADWRRVAEFVLTDLSNCKCAGDLPILAPKVCKVIHGKRVCK